MGLVQISEPKVVFLDVGQGDSMLFTHNNTQIVVDGGGNDLLVEKIHGYIPFYDRDIELLILTHPHLDHYGGLVRLMKEFKVVNVVLPPLPCEQDFLIEAFVKTLEAENAQIVTLSSLNIGGLSISLFNNQRVNCLRKGENINNSSIVSLFEFRELKILNMGDYENEESFKGVFGANILKAGHHCSSTSSSELFLKTISPEVAICSLGENNYGHPSLDVLESFETFGIQYFITKNEGDIILNLSSGLIYNEAGKLIKRL